LNDFSSLISHIDSTFRTKVLGTEDFSSQWKVPVLKDSEENLNIERIQVRNNVAHCIIKEMDTIIEKAWSLQDTNWQMELNGAIAKYRAAMKILTRHSEPTEDVIEEFQSLVDDFYEKWIDIFGDEGITNYIHMLSCGHIMYLMK
jgi:hypothetical protein